MVGDSLASQTEHAYKNILEILKTAGSSQENAVNQTIYAVRGQDIFNRVLLPHTKSGETS
jgi:enamine deaminase RidA (YjgF/YER057c/UK114 family)